MPHITGKSPLGKIVVPVVDGERRGDCSECHTDEKWLEFYVMETEGARAGKFKMVKNPETGKHEIVKERRYIDYDIIEKATGCLLYSVRQ